MTREEGEASRTREDQAQGRRARHRDDRRGSVWFAVSKPREGLASGGAADANARRALVLGAAAAHGVAACLRLARGYRGAVWRG
jgi:hypothetical protein